MNSPFLLAKLVHGVAFAAAVIGMLLGLGLTRIGLGLIGLPVAFFATMSAIRHVGSFFRVLTLERKWLTDPQNTNTSWSGSWSRSSGPTSDLPDRIFVLLVSVAESDGAANAREREAIKQFVLQRFPRPDLAARLMRWDVKPLRGQDLDILLEDLRRRLTPTDRHTVFFWAALVALIDEKFHQAEHDALQAVARGFGVAPTHARVLFQQAKAQILGGRTAGGGAGWGNRTGSAGGGGGWGPQVDPRDEALEVLGLDKSATPDEIRKRHRELAKKHHPDAHSHLGPVAQQEATDRFRRIQQAYETLTKAS
jgi:DnaJ-domain-containing protein 1